MCVCVCAGGEDEEKTIHPKRGHVDLSLEIATYGIFIKYIFIHEYIFTNRIVYLGIKLC